MHLFKELNDVQLNRAARFFSLVRFPAGQVLFTAGSRPDAFYIIVEGEVALSYPINRQDTQVDVLAAGDFFGEEALLLNRPHHATARAASAVTLLRADARRFRELLATFPQIQDDLERAVQSHQFIRKHRFEWLNEDEVVYQVRREHVAYLMLSLLPPSFLCLVGLVITLLAILLMGGSSRDAVLVIGLVLTLAGLLWGAWNWFDWSNDYYIVTNQRVVWIEKIIGLYESRSEAPLSTIQAVNQRTSFLGRILGYGDVIVSTYTSQVPLRKVGEPYQLVALIEEYWQRAQKSFQRAKQEEIRRSVLRILQQEKEVEEALPSPAPQKPEGFREPGFWKTYFSNIFQVRFEEGNTITYRKHWLILLVKSWKPLMALLALLAALAGYTYLYTQGFDLLPPYVVLVCGFGLIPLVIFPWWLYNYVDWRNDIYQVTDRSIFDIERKPFGTEIRKSGSLERILSLEHKRPGFWGYLFNFGNVEINFGDAKFVFQNVYEPARVQQEIFTRMQQHRLRLQQQEEERERSRVLELLEIYHQNIQSPRPPDQEGE